MTTKTHFETGAITAFGLGGLYFSMKTGGMYEDLNPETLMAMLNTAMIWLGFTAGAVYPDLSIESSPIGEGLGWEGIFGRRGITHSLLNIIGLGLWLIPAFILSHFFNINVEWLAILVLSIGAGCVHHMLLDTLTPSGVSWLFPLIDGPIRIPIVCGKTSETIFEIAYLVVMIPLSVHWYLF